MSIHIITIFIIHATEMETFLFIEAGCSTQQENIFMRTKHLPVMIKFVSLNLSSFLNNHMHPAIRMVSVSLGYLRLKKNPQMLIVHNNSGQFLSSMAILSQVSCMSSHQDVGHMPWEMREVTDHKKLLIFLSDTCDILCAHILFGKAMQMTKPQLHDLKCLIYLYQGALQRETEHFEKL